MTSSAQIVDGRVRLTLSRAALYEDGIVRGMDESACWFVDMLSLLEQHLSTLKSDDDALAILAKNIKEESTFNEEIRKVLKTWTRETSAACFKQAAKLAKQASDDEDDRDNIKEVTHLRDKLLSELKEIKEGCDSRSFMQMCKRKVEEEWTLEDDGPWPRVTYKLFELLHRYWNYKGIISLEELNKRFDDILASLTIKKKKLKTTEALKKWYKELGYTQELPEVVAYDKAERDKYWEDMRENEKQMRAEHAARKAAGIVDEPIRIGL